MIAPTTIPATVFYNAKVISFHDADTGLFEVERPPNREFARWDVRFLGCNGIELDDPGGQEAQENLYERLPPGTPVVLGGVKHDEYGGRYDAAIFYRQPS